MDVHLRTWFTIGPAVLVGLVITAIAAFFILRPDPLQALIVIMIGGFVMLLASIPGQLFWNRAFQDRILKPLGSLGNVMNRASGGDLTVEAPVIYEDEIDVLTDECNFLISSLSEIASKVRRSAESVSAAATELSASSEEINSSTMEI